MAINKQFDKTTPQIDNPGDNEFKKYIPVSEIDKSWGFAVHGVGHARIPPNTDYPPLGHPGSHRFDWKQGRVLQEYHFILVTEGKGIFESQSAGAININAGDCFILFPNEWHRYKPLETTGWTEYWVGFSGQISGIIMKELFFSVKQPVIQNCVNIYINNLFMSLFNIVIKEPFGYQRTVSGICLQLIAGICNIQKSPVPNKETHTITSRAKNLMHQKITGNFDFQSFCRNAGISYSKFRADFKFQTGFSPLQYFLLIKIEKAKELLNNTDMKTKQVAFSLGFKSDHYFSRLFKAKVGFTPQEFRAKKRK